MRWLLAAVRPVETLQCTNGVTLSLGVAVAEEMQPPEAEALLLAAGTAFCQAQAIGRTQVEAAGSDFSSAAPILSPVPLRGEKLSVGGV